MKILLILCIFVISGCSSIGKVYKYEDGVKSQLYQIETNKDGALTYKDKDVEIQIDSRKPNLWERFVQPIITGASNKTQGTVTAK